jgi:peptide/nickel transport system substrate-binding protein
MGEDWISANAQSQLTQSIMLATWKQAGFEITSHFLSTVEERSAQIRAERPGLYTGDGGSMETLGSDSIPTPENRWTGSNRGSYSSPRYDRLLAQWRGALDTNQRNAAMVQMARVSSEDIPSIPIHYNLAVSAHVNALVGPKPSTGPSGDTADIERWEWRP